MTAESHGLRANAAAGAVDPRETAPPVEFKQRRVPPDLDSRVFSHRVGLDATTEDEALIAANRAFAGLGRTLAELYKREATIRADSSKPADAHILRIAEMVEKSGLTPLPAVDGARKRLLAEAAEIDREIADSLRARMPHEVAAEIRSELKRLPATKRRQIIMADPDVAAAALSAKPFLSGLSQTEAEAVRREFLAEHYGPQQARRAKLDRAMQELDAGGERYTRSIFALRDGRVAEVQARAAAADKALAEPIATGDADV